MWTKQRLQSTAWHAHQRKALCCEISGCYGCMLRWHGLAATPPPIASPGIATAPRRNRLSSRVISTGPKPCHDSDGIGLWVVWDRASRKCEVLFGVRYVGVDGHENCGVQAGYGPVRRRGAFDGYRGGRRRGAVARDHDRAGRVFSGGG